jgi:glutathione peroxidase
MRKIVYAAMALVLAACNKPAPPQAQAAAPEAVQAALTEQQTRIAAAHAEPGDTQNAYQFEFPGLMISRVPLSAFRGDVVLVVNTASKCGFTPQYEGLQQIFSEYHARGFEIVGVPSGDFMNQELGSSQEIAEFCRLNYGVTFPMAAKTDVVGPHRHPFYQWAEAQMGDSAVPKWNFHKLLLDRQGRLIAAFPSNVTPTSEQVRAAIASALAPS